MMRQRNAPRYFQDVLWACREDDYLFLTFTNIQGNVKANIIIASDENTI